MELPPNGLSRAIGSRVGRRILECRAVRSCPDAALVNLAGYLIGAFDGQALAPRLGTARALDWWWHS
jgi:hypothetical protein